jgi:nitrogen fixation protein NifB
MSASTRTTPQQTSATSTLDPEAIASMIGLSDSANSEHAANSDLIRVAVATKGRGLVDEHFGHADSFHIYTVNGEQAEFLEVRPVTPYCQGGHGEEESLMHIVTTLSDCKAVIVSRVGVGPDDRLRAAGLEPIQDYDTIESAVLNYYQQYWGNGE